MPACKTSILSAVFTAAALALAPTALAQAGDYQPPRTADGKPDLQGMWSNVSLTSLERPANFDSLVISPEQAARIEAARAAANERSLEPTNPDDPAPPKGQGVGGYNSFYVDAGTNYAVIDGEARSSWIVDPPNGKIPYHEAGRKKFDEELYFVRNTFDGPEARPMAERCIVGFGSTGGPPMINVMYNNTYQFVQTPEYLMILVEMNHDARIIPIGDRAGEFDQTNPQYLGNSTAEWEGDTLVVKTTNFHPTESLRTFFAASFYLSTDAVVEERFTRVADDQVLYEFAVTDPKMFSQTWKAEMAFGEAKGVLHEYACHEGNYALPGILAGARRNDRLGKVNFAAESE